MSSLTKDEEDFAALLMGDDSDDTIAYHETQPLSTHTFIPSQPPSALHTSQNDRPFTNVSSQLHHTTTYENNQDHHEDIDESDNLINLFDDTLLSTPYNLSHNKMYDSDDSELDDGYTDTDFDDTSVNIAKTANTNRDSTLDGPNLKRKNQQNQSPNKTHYLENITEFNLSIDDLYQFYPQLALNMMNNNKNKDKNKKKYRPVMYNDKPFSPFISESFSNSIFDAFAPSTGQTPLSIPNNFINHSEHSIIENDTTDTANNSDQIAYTHYLATIPYDTPHVKQTLNDITKYAQFLTHLQTIQHKISTCATNLTTLSCLLHNSNQTSIISSHHNNINTHPDKSAIQNNFQQITHLFSIKQHLNQKVDLYHSHISFLTQHTTISQMLNVIPLIPATRYNKPPPTYHPLTVVLSGGNNLQRTNDSIIINLNNIIYSPLLITTSATSTISHQNNFISFTNWSKEITTIVKLLYLCTLYIQKYKTILFHKIISYAQEQYDVCYQHMANTVVDLVTGYCTDIMQHLCTNILDTHAYTQNLFSHNIQHSSPPDSSLPTNYTPKNIPTSLNEDNLGTREEKCQEDDFSPSTTTETAVLLDWHNLAATQPMLFVLFNDDFSSLLLQWGITHMRNLVYNIEFYAYHSLNMRLINQHLTEVDETHGTTSTTSINMSNDSTTDSESSHAFTDPYSPSNKFPTLSSSLSSSFTQSNASSSPHLTQTSATPSPPHIRKAFTRHELNTITLPEECQLIYRDILDEILTKYFDLRMSIVTLTPAHVMQSQSTAFIASATTNLAKVVITASREWLFADTTAQPNVGNHHNTSTNPLNSILFMLSTTSDTYLRLGLDELAQNVDFETDSVVLKHNVQPVRFEQTQEGFTGYNNYGYHHVKVPTPNNSTTKVKEPLLVENLLHPSVQQLFDNNLASIYTDQQQRSLKLSPRLPKDWKNNGKQPKKMSFSQFTHYLLLFLQQQCEYEYLLLRSIFTTEIFPNEHVISLNNVNINGKWYQKYFKPLEFTRVKTISVEQRLNDKNASDRYDDDLELINQSEEINAITAYHNFTKKIIFTTINPYIEHIECQHPVHVINSEASSLICVKFNDLLLLYVHNIKSIYTSLLHQLCGVHTYGLLSPTLLHSKSNVLETNANSHNNTNKTTTYKTDTLYQYKLIHTAQGITILHNLLAVLYSHRNYLKNAKLNILGNFGFLLDYDYDTVFSTDQNSLNTPPINGTMPNSHVFPRNTPSMTNTHQQPSLDELLQRNVQNVGALPSVMCYITILKLTDLTQRVLVPALAQYLHYITQYNIHWFKMMRNTEAVRCSKPQRKHMTQQLQQQLITFPLPFELYSFYTQFFQLSSNDVQQFIHYTKRYNQDQLTHQTSPTNNSSNQQNANSSQATSIPITFADERLIQYIIWLLDHALPPGTEPPSYDFEDPSLSSNNFKNQPTFTVSGCKINSSHAELPIFDTNNPHISTKLCDSHNASVTTYTPQDLLPASPPRFINPKIPLHSPHTPIITLLPSQHQEDVPFYPHLNFPSPHAYTALLPLNNIHDHMGIVSNYILPHDIYFPLLILSSLSKIFGMKRMNILQYQSVSISTVLTQLGGKVLHFSIFKKKSPEINGIDQHVSPIAAAATASGVNIAQTLLNLTTNNANIHNTTNVDNNFDNAPTETTLSIQLLIYQWLQSLSWLNPTYSPHQFVFETRAHTQKAAQSSQISLFFGDSPLFSNQHTHTSIIPQYTLPSIPSLYPLPECRTIFLFKQLFHQQTCISQKKHTNSSTQSTIQPITSPTKTKKRRWFIRNIPSSYTLSNNHLNRNMNNIFSNYLYNISTIFVSSLLLEVSLGTHFTTYNKLTFCTADNDHSLSLNQNESNKLKLDFSRYDVIFSQHPLLSLFNQFSNDNTTSAKILNLPNEPNTQQITTTTALTEAPAQSSWFGWFAPAQSTVEVTKTPTSPSSSPKTTHSIQFDQNGELICKNQDDYNSFELSTDLTYHQTYFTLNAIGSALMSLSLRYLLQHVFTLYQQNCYDIDHENSNGDNNILKSPLSQVNAVLLPDYAFVISTTQPHQIITTLLYTLAIDLEYHLTPYVILKTHDNENLSVFQSHFFNLILLLQSTIQNSIIVDVVTRWVKQYCYSILQQIKTGTTKFIETMNNLSAKDRDNAEKIIAMTTTLMSECISQQSNPSIFEGVS